MLTMISNAMVEDKCHGDVVVGVVELDEFVIILFEIMLFSEIGISTVVVSSSSPA